MSSAKHLFLTVLSIVLLSFGSIHLCAQTQQKPSDSASNSSSASTQGSGSKPAGPTSTQAAPPGPATSPGPAAKPTANSAPAATQQAPPAKPAAGQQARPANGGGLVWVNTESGVYHKPGTRWYGKTKKGKYMTEADARKAGYKPAAKE